MTGIYDIYVVISTIIFCVAIKSALTIIFKMIKSLMDPRALFPQHLKEAFTNNFFRGVSIILALVVAQYAKAYKVYEMQLDYPNITNCIMGVMLIGSVIYLIRRIWIIINNRA